ncbi:MAG: hypothetical protein QM775_19615 [Pirellulales bacterium]
MDANQEKQTSRRNLLKGAVAASLASATAADFAQAEALQADRSESAEPNPVVRENQSAGSTDWQLTRVKLDKSGGYRSSVIEGFCSKQSVAVGDDLEFFVSTSPAAKFQIEIFRMGYYGGRGARLMKTIGPLDGAPQPVPEIGPNRVRECRWPPVAKLVVPDDWPSGVYLGRLSTLTGSDGSGYWQSYVVFVVRDQRRADVLFQVSDNTWQAYNRWPDDFSLYTHPEGAHHPGVAVSFDRPYARYPQIVEAPQSIGSGEFLLWEYPLCYWLEQHGYDVTYCTNHDMLDGEHPLRSKAVLSVGHDEYWDLRQFETLQNAVQQGVSILFLSANTAYMVSPFTPASAGSADRIITRTASFGPMSEEETKNYGHMMGPFPSAGPDEATLIGARTTVPFNGGGDWICAKPEHWMFAGTGMKKGDAVPGLVGWEYHGDPADIAGLEIVGEGTVLSGGVRPGHWTATIYPGPKDNFVFNASTIWWAQGLAAPPGHMLPWSHWSRPHGPDERVQRMTHNLLQRAIHRTA